MSKRFIDDGLFRDEWFCELPNKYKLLWVYIITTCSHWGVFKVSHKQIQFYIGENFEPSEINRMFKGRIVSLEDGRKWFIPKFLLFQYPSGLTSRKPAIVSVRENLLKEPEIQTILKSLPNDYGIIQESLPNGLGTIKDMDKDMDKDKDKDKDKDMERPEKKPNAPSVDEVRGHLEGEYEKNASRFSPLTRSDLGRIADMYIISRNRNDWKDIHEKPITRWKRDCEAYAFYTAANGGIKKKPGNGEQITENKKDKLEWLK